MRSHLFARGLGVVSCVVVLGCGSSDDAGGDGTDGGGSDATSDVGPGTDTGAPGDTTASGDTGGDTGGDGAKTDGGGDGGPPAGKGRFPDTSTMIAILADQLPPMNDAQLATAAKAFVGTQKELIDVTKKLRAANPQFVVLHYHLAMWQSAPAVNFIIDGKSWGNDYPTVTTHEPWFWHDASGGRVASSADGKLLMNVSVPEFQDYWATSIATQIAAGEYDGVFLDSASPDLLQGEAAGKDPRLAGTAVKDTKFTELGGQTWSDAWQAWIGKLDASLAAKGSFLIPNTGAFVTTWDKTDYSLTAGIFSEGFGDPSYSEADWKQEINQLLALAKLDKIIILQNYLASTGDLAKRRYYLANYLLVKDRHTYLDYFASNTLQWFPEWGVDLGAATKTASTVTDLASGGVYRRDFAKGIVLVNPTAATIKVDLGGTFKRVEPTGGGDIDTSGALPGTIATTSMTTIDVPSKGGEILLK